MLTAYDLEKGEKVLSLLDPPKDLLAQVSGEKELTYQNGKVVLMPAHGSRSYSISVEENKSEYSVKQFSSLPATQNFYGLRDLDEFFQRLSDEKAISFLDNYIDSDDFSIFMMIKYGSFPRWAILDKNESKLMLTQELLDSNLNLPLLPYLDVQDKKVFKLFDSEYFDQVYEQDVDGLIIEKLKVHAPAITGHENKFLLCIYEN